MTLQTTVIVPPSREVTLTLPPETPVGPMTLTVNGEAPDEERRNPDTPEFRAFLERSHGLVFDLRDWRLSVQEEALANGQVVPSTKDLLTPTPENRRAFRIWREARHNRTFPE